MRRTLPGVANRQKMRAEQFRDNPTLGSISFMHAASANTLLAAALNERRAGVYRYANDHATFMAPGAIVLVVTAFDVWLTEALAFTFIGRPERVDVHLSTRAKYEAMCQHVRTVPPDTVRSELDLAIELRHELVHFLPRTFGAEAVPDWFDSLEARGLFFGAGEGHRWDFSQRVGGYRLAYWVFRTVEAAALVLRDAPQSGAPYLSLANNFTLYRRTTPPEELPRFDRQFKLALTTPVSP